MYESALLKIGFNVITRSKINTLMEEQAFIVSGAVTQEQALKIGKIAAADAVLFINICLSSDEEVWENIKLIKMDLLHVVDMKIC
jgi:hypothetical protein